MRAESQLRVASSSERRVNRGVGWTWRRELATLHIRNLSMTSAATFTFHSIYKMFIFYFVTPFCFLFPAHRCQQPRPFFDFINVCGDLWISCYCENKRCKISCNISLSANQEARRMNLSCCLKKSWKTLRSRIKHKLSIVFFLITRVSRVNEDGVTGEPCWQILSGYPA